MKLDQYAYVVTLTHANVEYPVRVIADTHDGMFVESEDIWAALGTGQYAFMNDALADKKASESINQGMRSRFPGFSGLEVRISTRPTFNGAHAQIHMKMKGKDKMHRMYFTWANTLLRRLPEEHLVEFNDIVRHIGTAFPHEFNWDDEADYQGKHNTLPITVFARGAQMGICKVHVDMPDKPQKVFRGSADRFVDLIIQAKAHIEENS